MDEIETLVHGALMHLHPPVGDLYARGVEFCEDPSRPGQVHLIAHIGREISRSLLRIISAELPTGSESAREQESSDGENAIRDRMRQRIGQALGLAPTHPVVSSWYIVHRGFEGRAHVADEPRVLDVGDVVVAFRQLTKLLWSRLAPYFKTDDQVVALLARPPLSGDVESVHALFLRPQLRFRFFTLCNSPGWVDFLDHAGFFSHAPDVSDPMSREMIPWPEGSALINVAPAAPELVVRVILERVPRDNQNPAVADRILRALELLPAEFLPSVVGLLTSILRRGHSRYAGPAGLAVAGKLVAAGNPKAVDVIAAMLGLRPPPAVDTTKPHRIISPPTYDLLEAVDDYYVNRLLREVVPMAAEQNPTRLARCLVSRLDRVERLLLRAGYDDASFSHHWLSRWTHSTRARDDLRADLARAIDGIAESALGKAPQLFPKFDAIVQEKTSDLMRRLRLRFMIAAGRDGAAGEIEEVISSDWIVDPEFGAREVAELLRRHFTTAGSLSKAAFVKRMEAGPNEDVIRDYCERHGLDVSDQEARLEGIKSWQEKRLRWFHEHLPEELHSLAARIEFAPQALDQQRQDLDEVGHWSSGAVWAGDSSPRTVEELRAMSDVGIVEFLETWSPTEAEVFDGPNRRGLSDRLRQLLSEDLEARDGLLAKLASSDRLDPTYLSAALGALAGLIKADPPADFPWGNALGLAKTAISATPTVTPENPRDRWARREGLQFLIEACRNGALPDVHAPDLVAIIDEAIASAPHWTDPEAPNLSDFKSIGMAALNSDPGVVADLIAVACRYLNQGKEDGIPNPAAQIESWLNAAITWSGAAGTAARWQLGHHLPTLLHHVDEWVREHEEDLLGAGMTDPVVAPTWGAYLLSYGLYDGLFDRLGFWYRRHAVTLERLRAWETSFVDKRDDQRISRHLLEHVGWGLVRGVIRFDGEEDAGLRQVFAGASGTDRAHLAWQVMHALDEPDETLQEGLLERIVRFWKWRLDALVGSLEPEDIKELDALAWFLRIDQLDPRSTINLAAQTINADAGVFEVRGHLWQALPKFVAIDPIVSVQMVEVLVSATLEQDYPYFHFEEIAPVIRALFATGNATARERASKIVHRLGEAGWSEFGQLLDVDQG